MNSPLRIDDMTEADVAAVCHVMQVALPPAPAAEQSLREELARPWAHVWIARLDAEPPVAFLVFWHVADELHVLNVAVDPDCRRRGIARALMVRAVEYAAARKVRHILLEVRRSNAPAIALYRGLGFYATGLRCSYYSDGEDAVEMRAAFDSESGRIVVQTDEIRLDG
jgi:ribosomal-protein-alanine N-acetyltransferase